jgi:hypothetical protein
MSLQAARDKAFEQIFFAKDVIDEKAVVPFFKRWLEALKLWEQAETFERAFSENRMCMRAAPLEAEFQMPANFLEKKKNELGLHDVSAVLLSSDKNISAQVFPKVGRQPLFIPIAHEKDLLLLYCIEHLAKQKRTGPVYDFYKDARARITRIKYGSDEDMKTTFLKTLDEQHKPHYRYGDAHETAGPVTAEVLKERRMNALLYQSRVLTGKVTDNNEVTVKIRQHDGGWPRAAVPGPESHLKGLPCDVPAGHYLLVGFDRKFKGMIDDRGKLVRATD